MKSYPRVPTIDAAFWRDPERAARVFEWSREISDAHYLHWEELRHRKPPLEIDTPLDWWFALKLKRTAARSYPELRGHGSRPASLASTAQMVSQLSKFDRQLAGDIAHDGAPVDAQTRDRYVSSSLMEEAIHSSLFEGAVSTRELAKDMLREGRLPIDRSERMIINNHNAMLRLQDMAKSPLLVARQFAPDFDRLRARRPAEARRRPDPDARAQRTAFRVQAGRESESAIAAPAVAAMRYAKAEACCRALKKAALHHNAAARLAHARAVASTVYSSGFTAS